MKDVKPHMSENAKITWMLLLQEICSKFHDGTIMIASCSLVDVFNEVSASMHEGGKMASRVEYRVG